MPATVLVVDDDPGVGRLIAALLSREGIAARLVGTARECLDAVAQAPPGLILLDLMLPDMNGLEVLQRLRAGAATASIPVVVISTMTDPSYKLRARELGSQGFLNKPFTPQELAATVRAAMGMPPAG